MRYSLLLSFLAACMCIESSDKILDWLYSTNIYGAIYQYSVNSNVIV